jgi:hypothetical protein
MGTLDEGLREELRKELRGMVDVDQELRGRWFRQGGGDQELAALVGETDERHTARLQEIVDAHGWPGRSLVGEEGADAAWVLVQHADHDPGFQGRCLALMQALMQDAGSGEVGEVSAMLVAYLTDRVCVNSGQPQVFGTQLFTDASGVFGPRPIEDPAGVDERRAAVGLGPLAEYVTETSWMAKGASLEVDKLKR